MVRRRAPHRPDRGPYMRGARSARRGWLSTSAALAALLLGWPAARADKGDPARFAVAAEDGGAARAAIAPARFGVAAENGSAARAAIDTLERGGSAVDAAIAASFVLGVTAPVSCGIGGGGMALVYDAAARKASFVDFREKAPAGFDPSALAADVTGATVGVPGEVAGLVELHRRWGRRSLAEDLDPAVRAAELGFEMSRHLVRSVRAFRSIVVRSPDLSAVLVPGVVGARALARNPKLGATLRRIGVEGEQAFYRGRVPEDLARAVQTAGGRLVAQDLAVYRPVFREPLRGHWDGLEIVTAPAPSAGGLLLLETLGLYPKAELSALRARPADYEHLLAEAFRASMADRAHHAGDPAFVPSVYERLLRPERLRAIRARIGYDRTHAPAFFGLHESGTSHLVVADGQGNVVSLTATINSGFGAGIVAPESGVLLNDELHDFTRPEAPARSGARTSPNAPRAGARPVSSMTPTLVLRDGVPVLALGGSGGLRIPQNVTQVLLNHLVLAKGLEDAVAAPRFFAPPVDPAMVYAVDQVPAADVIRDLAERGEQVRTVEDDTTAVQVLAFDRAASDPAAGVVHVRAAADPRKGGVAVVR